MSHPTREEFDTIIEHFIGRRLPGRPRQGILEVSSTPNYGIGSRLQLPAPDGRVLHYCYTTEALDALWGVFNDGVIHASDGLIGAHAEGAVVVNLDLVAPTVVADELAGGHLAQIWHDGGFHPFSCGIKSNLATDAGIVAITLENPLPVSIPAQTGAEVGGFPRRVRAYHNKYSSIVKWANPAGGHPEMCKTVVCVPLVDIPAERYFWGLTWGEVALKGYDMFSMIGRTTLKREVGFGPRGGAVYEDSESHHVQDFFIQRAGYVLFDSLTDWDDVDTADGDSLVMLQLDP